MGLHLHTIQRAFKVSTSLKKEVLIVLGAPNSPSGELSSIAISRLDCCLGLYSKGKSVLCTGGWVKHFNTSNEAHCVYAKRYLMQKGVLENDFLACALSKNTVDDAIKIKPIVSALENPDLKIITSAFHMERVQVIFNEILKGFNCSFMSAQDNLGKAQLQQLIKHEKRAIALIMKNGLYY